MPVALTDATRFPPRTPSTRRQEDAETCRGGPWIPLVCGCPLSWLFSLLARPAPINGKPSATSRKLGQPTLAQNREIASVLHDASSSNRGFEFFPPCWPNWLPTGLLGSA